MTVPRAAQSVPLLLLLSPRSQLLLSQRHLLLHVGDLLLRSPPILLKETREKNRCKVEIPNHFHMMYDGKLHIKYIKYIKSAAEAKIQPAFELMMLSIKAYIDFSKMNFDMTFIHLFIHSYSTSLIPG